MTGGADKGCFLGRSECPSQKKSSHAGVGRISLLRVQCAICYIPVGIELLRETGEPRGARDKTTQVHGVRSMGTSFMFVRCVLHSHPPGVDAYSSKRDPGFNA